MVTWFYQFVFRPCQNWRPFFVDLGT